MIRSDCFSARPLGIDKDTKFAVVAALACRLLGVQRRYTCEEIAESVGGKRVGTMAATELKRYKVNQDGPTLRLR